MKVVQISKITFFVLLCFVKISLADQLIRVHILNAPKIEISCLRFPYAMVDSNGTVLGRLYHNVKVERNLNFLKVGNLGSFSAPIIFQPIDNNTANNFITVNGKPYRGKIEISLANSTNSLSIINEVEVEEYLLGVIKYEMPPRSPIEALKAQAVVARTFALSTKRHTNYDFCSEVHCQIYRGVEGETEQVMRVVEGTAGEVLVYHDKIANVAYFSTCGGKTLSSEVVWGKASHYLSSRRCYFCKDSHHFNIWIYTTTYKNLEAILQRAGVISSQLTYIRRTSPLKKITLTYRKNNNAVVKLDLPISRLRFAVGPDKIKSSNFIIKNVGKENIIFVGKGAGHNVGLCQWGARGMALQGYDYKQILNYYFPECVIKKLHVDVR